MRLNKLSLVAAAALATSSLLAATATLDGNAVSLMGDITVANGSTLTINNDDAFTYSNKFKGTTDPVSGLVVAGGSGNVVKTGSGTLQIDSYSNITYYNGNTFVGSSPTFLTDAIQGSLTVQEGRVVVSGYLSQFVGGLAGGTPVPPLLDGRYAGFSSVVLNNNAVLDFSATQRNLATGFANYDGAEDRNLTRVKQFNTALNLNGAVGTTLVTGSSDARILVTMSDGQSGGIGVIEGQGQLAFNGTGALGDANLSTFTVRNDSTFTGDVFLVGGAVSLTSAGGGSLATAASVNFAQVTGWAYDHATVNGEWMPNYLPTWEAPVLDIQGAQRINNLQALFGDNSSATDYEKMYLVNGGANATVNLAAGSTLTINQEVNGYFRGTITDLSDLGDLNSHTGGGDIVKKGAGTLVLMPSASNRFDTLAIEAGGVISTVQGLGSGTVIVSSGASLTFVQNNPGNLEALLQGDLGSALYFQKQSTIKNINGDDFQVSFYGIVEIGSVNVLTAQADFKGAVIVGDGLTMSFNAASGDAFANASSVQLKAGSNGEETRLTFGDSNQTFRNFSGDVGTKVDLGRGTITLVQDAKDVDGNFTSTTYSGKIVGTGGLVKSGGGTLVLDGRDEVNASVVTYSGATTVKEGTLVLTGAKQLSNTSGLILTGTGTVTTNADQTFGALFGAAGTVLNMGAGTLTIGRTDAEIAALRAQETAPGVTPNAGRYLGTTAVDPVTLTGAVYNAAATVAYLKSVGMSDAEAESLAFAGSITGTGGLVKIGAETLTLTGVSTYTGATSVQGGTLRINADSISATSSIAVASGATLAVSGSGTFDEIVTGAGNFSKVGAGDLTLGGNVALTGDYIVSEGSLNLSANAAFTGNVVILAGATLNYAPTADITLAGTVTGDGTLAKSGPATLTITNAAGITGFAGDVQVNGGTLVTTGLVSGDIAVASGATYRAQISSATTYSGDLSGAGTLAIAGAVGTADSLTLTATDAAPTAFTGTLAASGTTVTAAVDNVVAGTVSLTGSTFALGVTTQTLAGLDGDASSKVTFAAPGKLTVSSGSFGGVIEGAGTLEKVGAGTLSLTSFVASTFSGTTTITEGTLVATPSALGTSVVTVGAAGTLALSNPDPVNTLTYTNALSGTGKLDKTGSGVVKLTNASAGFSGQVHVSAGTLEIGVGALTNAATSVIVEAAGIYQVDGTDVSAVRAANVTGAGSLALSGANTLTLSGSSYTGNTLLLNGATLDLAANGVTSMYGLGGGAASATSNVATAGALAVTQNIDGIYLGAFTGLTDLTVSGTGKLTLASNAVTAVTVDSGKLVLGTNTSTAVTLANGGALYVQVDTAASQLFSGSGSVSGAGNVIKTGAGTLTLNAVQTATLTNTGTVGVDQGKLIVEVASLPANITGLTTEGTGTLALNVATGSTSLATPITGAGKLEKSGAGRLNLGAPASTYTIGSTGLFTVSAGTLGGNFRTSGDLTVASGATLAPGFSPGVVTVNGDFTLSSGATLEVEINGTTADKVVVNGAATLAGNLLVKQDSTAGSTKAARGQSFTILTATDGVAGTFANADANGIVQLAPADIAATGIARVRLAKSAVLAGDPTQGVKLTMTTVTALNGTSGFTPHEGIGGLVSIIDAGTTGGLPEPVLAAVDSTSAENLSSAVNALSPLGLGSMYAMARDTSLRHEDRLRERLDQRRYDLGGYSPYEWEAFVVGSVAQADNKVEIDTPTFDTRTYGGLVGMDTRLASGTVVGGAAGYDNGTATMHEGAGKVEMNRVRATGFLSTKLNNRWYLDAGLSAGFGDYTTQRNTVTGRATGSTSGFDVGANVFTGTIVVLREDLHLTPFAGLSYAHHEFSGFTEKGGNGSALKVDGWSNDSLRASVGTGLGWWLPAGDWKWKLGVDVAYNHELLDDESDIDAAFVSGGSKFSTAAAALPADSLSVGPNAALHFDENNALSAGVNFEYGFDGRTYTGFNVAFRRRF